MCELIALPMADDPWPQRKPFTSSEETELEADRAPGD
jgi:hypothetical protein